LVKYGLYQGFESKLSLQTNNHKWFRTRGKFLKTYEHGVTKKGEDNLGKKHPNVIDHTNNNIVGLSNKQWTNTTNTYFYSTTFVSSSTCKIKTSRDQNYLGFLLGSNWSCGGS
jgi:hypothetical protein